MKNDNWKRAYRPLNGAFATKGNQWVSFNDVQFVKEKAEYVVNNKFGGVAVFTMDMDDFNNDCCRGTYPLLNTLSKTLRKIGNRVQQNNCKKPAPVTTPKPAEITTGYDDGGRFPPNKPTT